MLKSNTLQLKIGDLNIAISSSNASLNVYLSPIHTGFLVEPNSNVDLNLIVHAGIPDWILSAKFRFAANKINSQLQQSEAFWNIAEYNNKLFILIYDQQTSKITIASELNQNETTWNIYVDSKTIINNLLDPFRYPMGTLILYYLAIYNNAIFLHGCGLQIDTNCYIFTGVSGVGKTTISKLFKNSNVINDDRLLIFKNNNKYIIHNSPMFPGDRPASAKLDKIFLIRHASKNYHNKLEGVEAIGRLYALTIQHNFDRYSLDKNLEFVKNLAAEIPIFELGFIPDTSIVNYINDYVC